MIFLFVTSTSVCFLPPRWFFRRNFATFCAFFSAAEKLRRRQWPWNFASSIQQQQQKNLLHLKSISKVKKSKSDFFTLVSQSITLNWTIELEVLHWFAMDNIHNF